MVIDNQAGWENECTAHVDCWMKQVYFVGNSTDTLELASDSMEYEVPEPHMMSMIWCLKS